MTRRILLALVTLLCLPDVAKADNPTTLSLGRLKLPSGPGSLEGVGANAEPQLNQASVTYGVGIDLPAGYEGISPTLSLSYNSASGSGPVGMGWSLPTASIERMTARGLPTYSPSDLLSGAGGELVRTGGTETARVYRARFEGGFARTTWFDATGEGRQGYFLVELPNGTRAYFGATADGEIVPEAHLEGAGGTFRYMLVEHVDVFGHRTRYSYRASRGVPLLESVGWVFDAGVGNAPRYEARLTYDGRPDHISDAKSGREVVLAERVAGIRVLVRGTQLRRYSFRYEPAAFSGGLSRLAGVETYGLDDEGPYPAQLSFAYTQAFQLACMTPDCIPPTSHTIGTAGVDFRTGDVALVDMNSDGLPDVLDTRGGVHSIALQSVREDGVQRLETAFDSMYRDAGAMALSSPEVQRVDLNGDGRMDLVDRLNAQVLFADGSGDWSRLEGVETNLPSFAADRDLRFFDYDHDRAIDVIHLSRAGAWVYRNRGDGTFGPTATVVDGNGLGFSEDGLRLADMNGDGMLDLVQVHTEGVHVWLHLGFGRFSAVREMFFVDAIESPHDVQLTDVNGDGLADAVRVAGDEARFALSLAGGDFSAEMVLQGAAVVGGLPERTADISFQLADMNGSGSADLVYSDASGSITYVELFGERPNLLREVRNGLGRVTRFGYGSSVTHMSRDGGPEAWRHRLPHPMQTLDWLEERDELSGNVERRTFHYRNGYYDGEEHQFRGFADVEVLSVGDASIEAGRSVHHFDVGDTDRHRKGLLLNVAVSSEGRPLRRTQHEFGDCDVEGVDSPRVRHVCLTSTRSTEMEGADESEWATIESRFEYDGFGNRILTENRGVVGMGPDGTGACTPCEGGNLSGGACGDGCTGDELTQATSYVHPDQTDGRWILRSAYHTRTYSDPSGLVAESRKFYDGEAFEGLELGRLSHGIVVRSSRRLGDRWIDVERVAVGEDGEVLEVRDAMGHGRRFGYDDAGLLMESEAILLDDLEVRDEQGSRAYELRREVTYDGTLEQIIAATAWMRAPIGGGPETDRRETRYQHDGFGRLVAIALPGESIDAPSQVFDYELNSPVSRVIARQRSRVGGDMDLVSVQCFDGMGRLMEERARVRNGEWLVSNRTHLNARGRPSRQYPSFTATTGVCGEGVRDGEPFIETHFDALGRVVSIRSPDESIYGDASVSRIEYRPLRTLRYDFGDTDQDSTNFQTPSESVIDGLGRLVSSTQLLVTPELDENLGLLGPPSRMESMEAARLTARVLYDGLGRVSAVVDPTGIIRTQTLDLFGRVVEVEDPDAGVTQYSYDDAGRLLSRTDARGEETRFSYDEASRPLATWDPTAHEATLIAWAYDGYGSGCASLANGCDTHPGFLTQVSHPLLDGERGVETVGYDVRGRIVESRIQRGDDLYHFTSEFDNAGRLIGATMPAGITIEQRLDGLGRVTQIPGLIDSVAYTTRGRVERVLLTNGTSTEHEYDVLGRLSGLASRLPDGSALLDASYQLGRTGQILAVEDLAPRAPGRPGASALYAYDSLNRLIQAHLSPGTQAEEVVSYRYDEGDNLTRKVSSRLGLSPVHLGELRYGEGGAGPTQLTSFGHGLPSASLEFWQYDDAGNAVRQGDIHHEWDFMGRLMRSSLPRSDLSSGDSEREEVVYSYGIGRSRAQKRERGHFTEYIASGFEVRDGIATAYVDVPGAPTIRIERPTFAAELMVDADGDGVVTAGDAITVLDGDGLDASQRAAADRYPADRMLAASARRMLMQGEEYSVLHQNHLGTVIGETDSEGRVLNRQMAYPFGHPRSSDGALSERFFTGQERDRATGLSYHNARYLDLRVGRWISADPLFEQPGDISRSAFNRYAYANNSPIVSVDPSGLDALSVLQAFGEGFVEGASGAASGLVEGVVQTVTHPIDTAAGVVEAAVDTARTAARVATDSGYRAELVERAVESARETAEFVQNASAEDIARAGGRLAGAAAVDAAASAVSGGAVAVGARVGARVARVARAARATRARSRRRRRRRRAPCSCFAAGTIVAVAHGVAPEASGRPIEEVRVGDRVLTTTGGSGTDVEETWRVHDLQVRPEFDPEHLVDLTLLRPPGWLREHDLDGDGKFRVVLPELGLDGIATVVRTRGPPPMVDEPGRVVLAVVRHVAPRAVRLGFSTQAEPLLATPNHPFFSADQGDWVQAGALAIGEHVQTAMGVAELLSREVLDQPTPVWNLQVEGDSEYQVGIGRLRVHNNDPCPTGAPGGGGATGSGTRGRRGTPETRAQLDEIRDELVAAEPDLVHVGGGRDAVTGRSIPEEFIPGPTPGTTRGSSFVDLTFQAPDGTRVRVQTVDVAPRRRSGISRREEENAARIFQASAPGDRLIIIGKDPNDPVDVNQIIGDL